MNPITHLLTGWLAANADNSLGRRERAIITIAGVIPDIDAFGIIPEMLTRNSEHPLRWWTDYHHIIGHNIGFGLAITVLGVLLSRQRWKTGLFILLAFHIHLLADIVGARGPEGYQWPIPYLLPFSDAWQLTWSGQWALNAWPNYLITLSAALATLWLAVKRGYSPIEMISPKTDAAFIRSIRQRFGLKQP